MLHSHGQRDQRGDSPIGDAGPVDVLLQAMAAHDLPRMTAALAPAVRLSIPTLRIHVMGRGEVAAAIDAVTSAFSELDYTVRSRYLNVTRVTDEAVISGVHTRPLLGAAASYRQAKVPMRLIATHDGSVVTTIDIWPDVDAVRSICDELAHHLDSLAAKTGEMVSNLRATIPQPEARVVQGQEREYLDVEATLVTPATPPRSPSRTEGLKAPVPSRTRRRQGIIAGSVMLVAAAAIVGAVLNSILHGSGSANVTAAAAGTQVSPSAKGTTAPGANSTGNGSGASAGPSVTKGSAGGALGTGEGPASPSDGTSPSSQAASSPPPLIPNKKGQVDLSTDFLFEKNKATLTSAAHLQLAKLIDLVKTDKRVGTIYVDGYTDDTGKPAFNLALSKLRAKAVAAVLLKGLPPGSIVIPRGHGVSNAKGANLDEPTRKPNRRVMVTLPPIKR